MRTRLLGRSCLAPILFVFALCAMLVATGAKAQSSGVVSGTVEISGALSDTLTFTCFGRPVCNGVYSETIRDFGCSNSFTWSGSIIISGVDFSSPGPIAGTVDITNGSTVVPNGDGTCTYTVVPGSDQFAFTGTWDGTRATISFGVGFTATGIVYARGSRTPPVFPMTATGSITETSVSGQASFQPRPQDVGTQNSVYVFAMAPATRVIGAKVAKDTPVQCVLAQLNDSGQLRAVSASSLQAYVSGVLAGTSQSVTILTNVPTANVAGATFFVGYGTSSTAMIDGGVNQNAFRIPGGGGCDPQPPETGWWWNPAEGGRGYSLESRGNSIFFAAFLYDVSGRSSWYAAAGSTSLDGSLFTGPLATYSGGQTLGGPYPGRPLEGSAGAITLAFSDAQHGTMVWPGGTVAIERFNITTNGLNLAPLASQPESGWWWNPNESGRGFFMEWQGGSAFIAAYMYDEAGQPLWYLTQNAAPSTNLRSYSGAWTQYANGQPLVGAYRAPTLINPNVAPVTIQFSGPETAIMTLPNGRTTSLTRFRF